MNEKDDHSSAEDSQPPYNSENVHQPTSFNNSIISTSFHIKFEYVKSIPGIIRAIIIVKKI